MLMMIFLLLKELEGEIGALLMVVILMMVVVVMIMISTVHFARIELTHQLAADYNFFLCFLSLG